MDKRVNCLWSAILLASLATARAARAARITDVRLCPRKSVFRRLATKLSAFAVRSLEAKILESRNKLQELGEQQGPRAVAERPAISGAPANSDGTPAPGESAGAEASQPSNPVLPAQADAPAAKQERKKSRLSLENS